MKHLATVKMLRPFIALILTLSIYSASAQVQVPKYASMGPNTNAYYEYLPQGYETSGNKTYPLIIFIHGVSELGDGSPGSLSRLLYTGLAASIGVGELPVSVNVNGESHSFIVISPQFINWPNPGDIDGIINYAASRYRVNTSRIYLTGLSMGGGVVWDYAGYSSAYANRVAAIVPICGASWPDYGRSRIIAGGNVAVWAHHNRHDPTVSIWNTETYLSQINEAPAPNPRAKANIYDSWSHDAWTFTYNSTNRDESGKTIYEWMLQYSKGSAPPPSNNQVPTANAGADQTISTPTNSVQLSGSGTDPDGSITSYSWRKISGPAAATLSNANIANPAVNNLIPGNYIYRLTVNDNGYATASDDMNIIVKAAIPGKIEAEGYSTMNGVQTENTADAGGGQNVGWIDNNDWMDYNAVNVTNAGTYTVNFRVATPNTGARFDLRKGDGTVLTTVTIPNTGGYQNWQTVSATVTLAAGEQNLKIYCTNAAGGWNINWMDFVQSSTPPPPPPPPPPTGSTQKIEAENYSTMNGVRTENTSDAGGGLNVAWQDTNDWMDYSVNVSAAGTYTVNFRVATMFATPQFQVRKADGSVLATVNVPNTGGFQNWTTVSASVALDAGTQTIRIHTTNAAGGWNFNWFEIAGGGSTPPPPPPPPPTGSTQKIEAENYSTMNGVRTENTNDAGGGLNVAWQDTNDWMDYSVNVSAAGTYTFNFRVATMFATPQFQVRKADGSVLAVVNVPNTGGFQNWTIVSASVALDAGTQTIRIHTTNAAGGWNFNWFEIVGGGSTPPPTSSQKIEAENYSTMNGVRTENTNDAGGGLNVAWQDTNDWMDYSVNVSAAGTYTFNFRVATMFATPQFQVRKADGSVLATVNVPNTGGFQNWTTVSTSVALAAGTQTIRIHTSNAAGGWNFNWFEITSGATSSTSSAEKIASAETETATSSASMQVFPNPVSDRFSLTVNNELTGAMKVEVINMQGAVAKQFSLNKTAAGTAQFYLSIGELPTGNYIIRASMQTWTEATQIVKE